MKLGELKAIVNNFDEDDSVRVCVKVVHGKTFSVRDIEGFKGYSDCLMLVVDDDINGIEK